MEPGAGTLGFDAHLDSQQNWLQVSPALTDSHAAASPQEQRHLHPLLPSVREAAAWVSVPAKSPGREAVGIQHRRNRPRSLQSPALFLEGKSCSLHGKEPVPAVPWPALGTGDAGWCTRRHSEPGRPCVPGVEISDLASGSSSFSSRLAELAPVNRSLPCSCSAAR